MTELFWIDVNLAVPSKEEAVLVYSDETLSQSIAFYKRKDSRYQEGWYKIELCRPEPVYGVTHWMILPPDPDELDDRDM